MILFCLPYAGGSEAMYYSWKKHLDPTINLEAVKLKGRGKRHGESFYKDLDDAIEDIFSNIKDKITYNEYAFFGHSMGAIFIFELYYKLRKENLKMPAHIFFSGQDAPCVRKKVIKKHMLPDDEFLDEVIKLGGTPKEILENKELFEYILPILRSDFKLVENYVYREREDKIECDVTVFGGKEDDITIEELFAWKNHCDRGFKVYTLEGDHFFINNNTENITNIICSLCKRDK